jgi:hypothetical protein
MERSERMKRAVSDRRRIYRRALGTTPPASDRARGLDRIAMLVTARVASIEANLTPLATLDR